MKNAPSSRMGRWGDDYIKRKAYLDDMDYIGHFFARAQGGFSDHNPTQCLLVL